MRDGEGGTGEGGGAEHMRTRVYYNENDPAACEWLRELMDRGLIPGGDIDGRSIADVEPDDLGGYTQCHFFAGIGGWAYALRLAGVPDLRCWTGSCPCQPFSPAGAGRGTEDERHLWPEFLRLIAERRPRLVFGEQVEEAIAYGWLELVSSDLEAEGYAVGAVVLGAHSVGAPHIRQRLYWVADSGRTGERHDARALGGAERQAEGRQPQPACEAKNVIHGGAACGVGDAHDGRQGLEGRDGHEGQAGQPSTVGDFWSECDWLPCRDGKARPTEPGTFPLADGVPQRMVLLKGYGNAVVPQVAAAFVKALIG